MGTAARRAGNGHGQAHGQNKRPAEMGEKKAKGLTLLVECHHYVIGLQATLIERLVLLTEGKLHRVRARAKSEKTDDVGALPDLLEVGGRFYAAWDLGELLGLGSQKTAWVLMTLDVRGQHVPIALRTGRCLAVTQVGEVTSIPEGVYSARTSAFHGAFLLPDGQRSECNLGLSLDPDGLMLDNELERSALSLANAPQRKVP